MAKKNKGKGDVGCAALFGLPFLAFGLFAGYAAMQRFSTHGAGSREAWFFLLFHLVFTAVGAGLPWLAWKGAQEERRRLADLATNADALWLTRPDWASGRIDYDSGAAIKGMIFLAFIWNALSMPAAYGAITQEVIGKGKNEALIVLIFPVVGLVIIGAVIRAILQARRFGKSRFVMESIPGVIGRVMRGVVVTGVDRSIAENVPFTVRLTCFHRKVTGSGKNRNTRMIPQWHDEQKFKGVVRRDNPQKLAVPVAFSIPSDAKPVTLEKQDDRILWQLKVTAEVPGVDYESEFELPIFRTPDSPEPGEAVVDDGPSNAVFEARSEAPVEIRAPQSRGIQMRPAAGGSGVTFRFAPLRNIGTVIGLSVFSAIWGGAIWFMHDKGAPILFPIVFGMFLVLMLMALFTMIVVGSSVTALPGRIEVVRGPFGIGTPKSLVAADVDRITVTSGMQSGQTYYWDVNVVSKHGKKLTVVTSMKDRNEAEWIATSIARAAGIKENLVRINEAKG